MTAMRTTAIGVFALGLAWGCASGSNPTVQAVRTEYQQVSTDAKISQYAPLALDDARKAVARLEAADRRGLEESELNHLAYVARGRFEIAKSEAAERALEDKVKALAAERDRLLLEARSSEVRTAQSETERLRAELAMRDAQQADQERQRGDLAVQEAQRADADRQRAEEALEQQKLEGARVQQELDQEKAEGVRARERAEQLRSENRQLQMRETEQGIVVTMGDVFFATGRAELQAGARDVMQRVAEYLNEFPDRSIEVGGHTDSVGAEASNQRLSERRAEAVADMLRSANVASDRIRVKGYGENSPIAPNENVAGRQQNRRVDIILANQVPGTAPVGAADRR